MGCVLTGSLRPPTHAYKAACNSPAGWNPAIDSLVMACNATNCPGPCKACDGRTEMCVPVTGKACTTSEGRAGHCTQGVCQVRCAGSCCKACTWPLTST